MAQDEKIFRSLFSSASFISDRAELYYLKSRILHRALFSHLKLIFVTLYFTFFGKELYNVLSLLLYRPPPPKKSVFPLSSLSAHSEMNCLMTFVFSNRKLLIS